MHVRSTASILIGALVCAVALFGTPAFAASENLTPQRAVNADNVDLAPMLRAKTFPRSVAWWPFSTGPFYGHTPKFTQRASNVLRLPVGSFETGAGLPIPSELTGSLRGLAGGKKQHFVVQLRPAAFENPQFRTVIGSLGAEIVGSLPVGGLMLRMDRQTYERVANSPLVQFVEPFHPAYKIHPTVGHMPQATAEEAASPLFRLELTLFRGEPLQPTLDALADLGVTVEVADDKSSFASIWVTSHALQIPQIAHIESIRLIRERGAKMLTNVGATMHQSDVNPFLGGLHYWKAGVDGDNQLIAIVDSGLAVDAGDFAHTRADSGWPLAFSTQGPNGCHTLVNGNADAAGVDQDHRKVACYTRAQDIVAGGSGDYSACDNSVTAPGSPATHGQVSASVAAGNATRGSSFPLPAVPDPSDGLDDTYCQPFTDTSCATPIVYGQGFWTDDPDGIPGQFSELDIAYDGVAKGARVIMVDIQNGCPETAGPIAPGFDSARIPALKTLFGANIQNQSFGSNPAPGFDPSYPADIDGPIWDRAEILVTQSAGNEGPVTGFDACSETIGNIGNEASCKNCLSVGATNGTVGEAGFTSVGPALSNVGSGGINDGQARIAPRIMAQGLEDACRSFESGGENQTGPATCAVQSTQGTSFSAPNAAGMAALIGEYLAEGYYPDGTNLNATNASDKVAKHSSALTQAILVASTNPAVRGGNANEGGRANTSWGWGVPFLNNVLPLASDPATASGLILHSLEDLNRTDVPTVLEGVSNLPGLGSTITGSTTVSQEFEVLNDNEDLRVAMVWYEPETGGAALTNDLDLEVRYCGGNGTCGDGDDVVFQGNAFHEDNDQNCADTATTPNPGNWDLNGDGSDDAYFYTISNNAILDAGFLTANYLDNANNVEAIFVPAVGNQPGALDVDGDADGSGDWPTVTPGKWEIAITCNACPDDISPAVAIAGPVAAGSGVRFDKNPATCNSELVLIVSEVEDGSDPVCATSCTTTEVSNRTSIQVLDENGSPTGDTLSGITFNSIPGTSLRFESDPIPLSADIGVAADGILAVDHLYSVEATYTDNDGAPNPRISTTRIDCQPDIEVGTSGQIGLDSQFLLIGGCDDDPYFDQDEAFSLSVNFFNLDEQDLIDAVVSLLVCDPDTFDASTGTCTNNSGLTVHNNDTVLGFLPALTTQLTRFALSTNGTPAGRTEVDLAVCLSGAKLGQQVKDCSVRRVLLQADDEVELYSTDCPTGCTVDFDRNFDEKYENFITPNAFDPLDFVRAGLDETSILYGNMQAAGDCTGDENGDGTADDPATCGNPGFAGLWNWDGSPTDDEGFRTGITPLSVDVSTLTPNSNWGEDENFNGIFDSGEDKADTGSTGGVLDQNFGQDGGCGYMTATGCWHTGTIFSGGTPGTACRDDSVCEQYDKEDGTDGVEYWIEMLRTPAIHPVNFGTAPDGFDWRSQIMAWEWNMQADLGEDEGYLWEFDVDVDDAGNIQLGDDFFPVVLLNDVFFGFGLGAINGGQLNIIEGAPVFADTVDDTASGSYGDEYNGTIGGNRAGLRGCYFEQLDLLTLAGADPDGDGTLEFTHAELITNTPKPLDDDCDNEVDFGTDGCPGTCGVDDDGNGIVDDLAEACPCFTCTAGPRQGMGCSDHPYCNPSGDVTTGDNRCLLDVDSYTANPSANTAFSDKLPGSTGTPRAYGDDVCGDGAADEGVFASFGPGTGQRQTRNYGAEAGNFGQIEFTTLEDLFGPPGDTWQAELGFVAFEPQGAAGDPSYGVAVDDMLLEWREMHPINQTTNTCSIQVGNNGPGQCASIGMGATANTFEGDGAIPVTVIDPDPTDNDGADGCAVGEVRIEAYSEAERTPTAYCLSNGGSGIAYSGFIKTTTQIRNTADDLVFVAFNFADTPSVTARYFDKNDGVNAYSVGADGQPGIASFDDDGDGTIDEADELCPVDNTLGTGRSPHVAGQAARFSDDSCGCPDNPIVDVTLSTFNAVDLLVTKVTATDTLGDGDGWADGNERINLDITIRNLSNVDLENITLKLSSNSPAVGCLVDDEVKIPFLAANDDTIGGPDEFDTVAGGDDFAYTASDAVTRSSTAEDLTARFSLAMQANVPANEAQGIFEEIPIQGLFTQRTLEVVHNLNATSVPTSAADIIEDFEDVECTQTGITGCSGQEDGLLCQNKGPNGSCTETTYLEFHAMTTGDNAAELDGTRCQYNDPANPFGNNTDPNDACELGEGYDNATHRVHLHGPGANNCNNQACSANGSELNKSHSAGNRSLHIGFHPQPGQCPLCDQDAGFGIWDGTTMDLNRMRWAEIANNIQLGPGAAHPNFTEDPQLSYWTQMSITDGGLFGASRGSFAWDAHRVYVCVDDNDNNHCDSTEAGDGGAGTGVERWEPISASLNPETNARVAAFINCGYEPSDDGNNEDDFFLNALDVGPSSTCFGTVVDTCMGRTRADNTSFPATFGTLVQLSSICFPETGVIDDIVTGVYEAGSTGAGIWAKREYDLQKYKGRKVLFRWHIAPTGIEGIEFTGAALGAQGGNRDDGIYVDDIQVDGVANDFGVSVDNADPGSDACVAGNECGSVVTRVATLPFPRNRADGSPRPALACSDPSVAFCDFNRDSTLDTAATSASLNAPGRPALLLADKSSADKCLGGALEFRFELSGGTLIRDWLTRPDLLVNPSVDTTYVVKVRCSTDPSCTSQASMLIDVPEVAAGDCRAFNLLFNQGNKTTFSWQASASAGCGAGPYDAAKGDIGTMTSASGSFASASCLENDSVDLLSTDATTPTATNGFYYLVREGTSSYDNDTGELPAANRDATLTACP